MPTTISSASERPNIATSASNADTRLEIDATRARQTERPPGSFREVLAGSVSLLMSGAELATHVVAGPVMAAAVHDARVGAVGAISGPGLSGPGGAAGVLPVGGGPAGAAGLAAAGAGPGGSDMGNIQAMMQDGQSSNMQMLALQQQIQEESQRFTTVSNVMRAKYDTAKAAVSNIRA
jgi:hypothetical protein